MEVTIHYNGQAVACLLYTSGLDYHRMLEVSNMIRKLNDENKVIIIVSHDFEFLGRTCDKIFDMEGCSKERR